MVRTVLPCPLICPPSYRSVPFVPLPMHLLMPLLESIVLRSPVARPVTEKSQTGICGSDSSLLRGRKSSDHHTLAALDYDAWNTLVRLPRLHAPGVVLGRRSGSRRSSVHSRTGATTRSTTHTQIGSLATPPCSAPRFRCAFVDFFLQPLTSSSEVLGV
jgi:hypothetical protein